MSAENYDKDNRGQLVINLSSYNASEGFDDSFTVSNLAVNISDVQERSILWPQEEDGELMEEESGSSQRLRRRRFLDVEGRGEELYQRSLTNVHSIEPAAPPVLTIINGDSKTSVQPLPYMKSFEEFSREQEKNHERRMNRQVEQDAWFNKFSKWSFYSSHKAKRTKISSPVKPLRNHSSIRRKDYSVDSEVSEFKKKGKFIFHKGFSLRSSNHRTSIRREHPNFTPIRRKNRFQNEQELLSFLRYINIPDMKITDVVNDDFVRMFFYRKFSPKTMLQVNPNINYIDISLSQYSEALINSNKDNSDLKVLKRPSITRSQSRSKRRVIRSKTLQPKRLSCTEKLNPELYSLWNSYMRSIIAKRISLRLACMKTGTIDSLSSSFESSSENYRRSYSSGLASASFANSIETDEEVFESNSNASQFETRPPTSVFSVRNSLASADQNRKSFHFPPAEYRIKKIAEEVSISSINSRNTLA